MDKLTLPYIPDGEERHLLDVYFPVERTGAPVVVVIHGGGMNALSKERMAGVSERLAEDGFCAVTPNYRLLKQAPFPAQLEDVLTVMEWVHGKPAALEGVDCSKVAVLGASAGSYLGLLVAGRLGKARVSCLVSVSGPHSRKLMDGSTFDDALELLSDDFPPVLHTHSRRDEVVSVRHAEEIQAALADTNIPHEVFIYDHRPETDHAIWVPGTSPPVFLDFLEEKMHSFLAQHLGLRKE